MVAPQARAQLQTQPAARADQAPGCRQLVDGVWLPAYARVDDTLHFQVQSIHVREIVKFKDYVKAATATGAANR